MSAHEQETWSMGVSGVSGVWGSSWWESTSEEKAGNSHMEKEEPNTPNKVWTTSSSLRRNQTEFIWWAALKTEA